MWALGTCSGTASEAGQTYAEHWNGEHWQEVEITGRQGDGWLNDISVDGISVDGANRVWTVGIGELSQDYTGETLVQYWDGSKWEVVASPRVGEPRPAGGLGIDDGLNASEVSPTGTLWVAGTLRGRPLAAHFDARPCEGRQGRKDG